MQHKSEEHSLKPNLALNTWCSR